MHNMLKVRHKDINKYTTRREGVRGVDEVEALRMCIRRIRRG